MDQEREQYQAPADPEVVGSMSQSGVTFSGYGTDYSFYSSIPA